MSVRERAPHSRALTHPCPEAAANLLEMECEALASQARGSPGQGRAGQGSQGAKASGKPGFQARCEVSGVRRAGQLDPGPPENWGAVGVGRATPHLLGIEGKARAELRQQSGTTHGSHTPAACSFPGANARSWASCRLEAGGCAVRASPGRLGSLAEPQRRGTSP